MILLSSTTLTLNTTEELLQKGCKAHDVVIMTTVVVKSSSRVSDSLNYSCVC